MQVFSIFKESVCLWKYVWIFEFHQFEPVTFKTNAYFRHILVVIKLTSQKMKNFVLNRFQQRYKYLPFKYYVCIYTNTHASWEKKKSDFTFFFMNKNIHSRKSLHFALIWQSTIFDHLLKLWWPDETHFCLKFQVQGGICWRFHMTFSTHMVWRKQNFTNQNKFA